jgi:hypothetical protein
MTPFTPLYASASSLSEYVTVEIGPQAASIN